MLINCPECELQVSDKALNCPHCGFPMKKTSSKVKSTRKRMRLPNGFGQITEIKNKNLRNPYRAMVTIGKDENGRPICKLLKPQSYFSSYKEAYEALVEYNKNPYDLESDMTMGQLYEKWSSEYFPTLKSPSSIRTLTAAWAYCSEISKMRVADVRARHIKGVIENGTTNKNGIERLPSAGTKSRIKSLLNIMLDYAVEYELTDRNYARTFNISSDVINEQEEAKRGHISFTDQEMEILWKNINVKYVDMILVQCYMGWRPQELVSLKTENISLEEDWIIGGMKTEAGIDRKVPIHSAIKFVIDSHIGGEYLFEYDGKPLTYDKYQARFKKVIAFLGLNPEHRPHDPRKQFVTMAKKYNVDEYAIKKMIGHEINDITEKVYTDRDFNWLKEEIEKIKKP